MIEKLKETARLIQDLTKTRGGAYVLGIMTVALPCYFVVDFITNSIERERKENEKLIQDKKELDKENRELLKSSNLEYNKGLKDCESRLLKYKELIEKIVEK